LWLIFNSYSVSYGVYQGIVVYDIEDRMLFILLSRILYPELPHKSNIIIYIVSFYYLCQMSVLKVSRRWIGSLNTFLVTAVGLVSGALYDKGYL
jgi:hypothetical protein